MITKGDKGMINESGIDIYKIYVYKIDNCM